MDAELQKVKLSTVMKKAAIKAAAQNKFLARAKAMIAKLEQDALMYFRGLPENVKVKQVYDAIPEEYKVKFSTESHIALKEYYVTHEGKPNAYENYRQTALCLDFEVYDDDNSLIIDDPLDARENGLLRRNMGLQLPIKLPMTVSSIKYGKGVRTKVPAKPPKFLQEYVTERKKLIAEVREYVTTLYHAMFSIRTMGKLHTHLEQMVRFITVPEKQFYAPVPVEMYKRANDMV